MCFTFIKSGKLLFINMKLNNLQLFRGWIASENNLWKPICKSDVMESIMWPHNQNEAKVKQKAPTNWVESGSTAINSDYKRDDIVSLSICFSFHAHSTKDDFGVEQMGILTIIIYNRINKTMQHNSLVMHLQCKLNPTHLISWILTNVDQFEL